MGNAAGWLLAIEEERLAGQRLFVNISMTKGDI